MTEKISDCTDEMISSEELLQALLELEEVSKDQERYYALIDINDKCEMAGVFFKAKTPHGALLRIYQYMKGNVPLWMGLKTGEYGGEITDLVYGEPANDRQKFIELCKDWIEDHTISFSKIVIV